MKIALLIKYIGTTFEGFQAQPSGNTVQQHLTAAVSKAVGRPCNVTGCSRTDSGVHANGFVAVVTPADSDVSDEWCRIPAGRFHRAVKQYLHDDIGISGAAYVSDSFHPRYDAVSKEYVYLFKDSPEYDPFLKDRAWQLRRRLIDDDIAIMNDTCRLFLGKHDFCGFMSKGSSVTDTVREVKTASVERDGNTVRFTVSADGFLYNMVRIMAGTLVEAVSGGNIDVNKAIACGTRSGLGVTAPPEGLYLNRVFYAEPIDFICE